MDAARTLITPNKRELWRDSAFAATLAALAVAGMALLWGSVARLGGRLEASPEALGGALALAALVGLGGCVWLIARPRAILFGLLFVPAMASVWFADRSVNLGPGKLYIQDVFFGLFFAWMAKRWLESSPGTTLTPRRVPLAWPLAAMLALGAFQTVRALKLGIDFNDALGDFRRGYFYLLAYLFPLMLPRRREALRFFEILALGTALALIIKGLGQGALGKIDRRMQTDAAHILNHFEATLVSFLAFYCLARLAGGKTQSRAEMAWALAGMALATMAVVLANFRAVWLGFLVGGLVVFSAMPPRVKGAMMTLGFAGALAAGGMLFALKDFEVGGRGQTVGAELSRKIERARNYDRDINVLWRYQSYQAALESWRERPWLGAGLGRKTSFYYVASDGNLAMASRHRIHNSYLWLLQTAGVVGLTVALWFHGLFFVRAWRALRRKAQTPPGAPPLAAGLLGFYAAFMTATALDVLLEQSIPIIWLATAMGAAEMSLGLARERSRSHDV
jgi:O-antigen ligase